MKYHIVYKKLSLFVIRTGAEAPMAQYRNSAASWKMSVLIVGADIIRPDEGTSKFAETLGEIVTCCRVGG